MTDDQRSAHEAHADADVGSAAAAPDAESAEARRKRFAATSAQVARLRARAEATTAGEVQRRISEMDLLNSAAILSALAMVLIIPALVSVDAFLPAGSARGIAASWARHLSLSPAAAADARKLFLRDTTVPSPTTAFSALFTIVSAYAWPTELQKAYLLIWGLPRRGVKDLWRPILWVPSLFALFGVVAGYATVSPDGFAGGLLTVLVGGPLVFGWAWWTQHLLLSGRVSWRSLLPGAVATALGLLLMSVLSTHFVSSSITYNYDRYGPIGVVFVLLTWLTAFSVMMLAGALVGHTIWRRHAMRDDDPATSDEPAQT